MTTNWFVKNTCLHPDYRKLSPGRYKCTHCEHISKIGNSCDPVDEMTMEWRRLSEGILTQDFIRSKH